LLRRFGAKLQLLFMDKAFLKGSSRWSNVLMSSSARLFLNQDSAIMRRIGVGSIYAYSRAKPMPERGPGATNRPCRHAARASAERNASEKARRCGYLSRLEFFVRRSDKAGALHEEICMRNFIRLGPYEPGPGPENDERRP
jgi:hypothetical protein